MPLVPSKSVSHEAAQTSAAMLESCTILDVNRAEYTVDIITEFSNRRISDVPLMAPYCHPDGVDGIYFLPEPGADAQLLWPSDKGKPRIIAFEMPTNSEVGATGGRPLLNPGDLYLATRDNNHISLRRGGLIEIFSTALAQRMYIPVGNVIRDIFGQYEALSPLGNCTWRHSPIDSDNADPTLTEVLYTFASREFVGDEKVSIQVRAGHIPIELYAGSSESVKGNSSQVYLELLLDPQGQGEKFVLRIDKAGNIMMRTEGGSSIEIRGRVLAQTHDLVSWKGAGGLQFTADTDANVSWNVSNYGVDAHSDIIHQAGGRFVVKSADIQLGESATEQAVLGNKLAAWLKAHTHYGCGPPQSAWAGTVDTLLSSIVKVGK